MRVMAARSHRAIDVAHLFLYWANQEGDLITNLKMQKLLYYAQAWHLVNLKRLLFSDPIEAWQYGPVIASIYDAFKGFGPRPISYTDKRGQECLRFGKVQLAFLREFYERFIGYSAHVLVSASHNEQPWKEAMEAHKPIAIATMKAYYTRQLRAAKST